MGSQQFICHALLSDISEMLDKGDYIGGQICITTEVTLTLVCFAQGKVANVCESEGADCNEKKQKDWANEPWKHLKDFAWVDTKRETVGVIDTHIFLLNEYIF